MSKANETKEPVPRPLAAIKAGTASLQKAVLERRGTHPALQGSLRRPHLPAKTFGKAVEGSDSPQLPVLEVKGKARGSSSGDGTGSVPSFSTTSGSPSAAFQEEIMKSLRQQYQEQLAATSARLIAPTTPSGSSESTGSRPQSLGSSVKPLSRLNSLTKHGGSGASGTEIHTPNSCQGVDIPMEMLPQGKLKKKTQVPKLSVTSIAGGFRGGADPKVVPLRMCHSARPTLESDHRDYQLGMCSCSITNMGKSSRIWSAPPDNPVSGSQVEGSRVPATMQASCTSRSIWTDSHPADLEALDVMLDQLMVLDPRIRLALAFGPPIRFETVLGESGWGHDSQEELDDKEALQLEDHTFITSVTVEEGTKDELPTSFQEQEGRGTTGDAPVGMDMICPAAQVPLDNPQEAPISRWLLHSKGLDDQMTKGRAIKEHLHVLGTPGSTAKLSAAARAWSSPVVVADLERDLEEIRKQPEAPPSYDDLYRQIEAIARQYTCGSCTTTPLKNRRGTTSPRQASVSLSDALMGITASINVEPESYLTLTRPRDHCGAIRGHACANKNPPAVEKKATMTLNVTNTVTGKGAHASVAVDTTTGS